MSVFVIGIRPYGYTSTFLRNILLTPAIDARTTSSCGDLKGISPKIGFWESRSSTLSSSSSLSSSLSSSNLAGISSFASTFGGSMISLGC